MNSLIQQPDAGQRGPLECPEGTYSNAAGLSSCTSCDEGYFCDGIGLDAAARTDCPAGYYCPSFDSFAIPIELSETTSVDGTLWSALKATAMPDATYKNQSWFFLLSGLERRLLEALRVA